MKKTDLGAALIFLLSLVMFASAQTSELDAVKIPLENYIKAHATGDPEFARKAFHTEGSMTFVRDGKFVTETFDAFIKRAFTGKPAADEDKRKDHRRIGKIEIVGNAATATVILEYPTVKFTDFMTLLKFGGEWKIVNKSFFAEPRAAIELKKN
ncbi:MAG: nuclear transport factor 2 family protein [Pyrinomonadaceae bacterium]